MNDWQAMVREFHRAFEQPAPGTIAPRLRHHLRAALIGEEAHEARYAILDALQSSGVHLRAVGGDGDTPAIPVAKWAEIIDGLCDLIYVAIGTAVEMGVDLDPFFREVHRTNMAKQGGGTNNAGKLLKPEGWEPPRIADMLLMQCAASGFADWEWQHPPVKTVGCAKCGSPQAIADTSSPREIVCQVCA